MVRHLVFGVVAFVLFSPIRLHAGQDTIGTNGINSAGLGLTGAGIAIGQVEPGRPGRMGDDAAAMLHSTVNPTAVFRQNGMSNTADTDDHAEQVAGIMISTDGDATGVATDASLFASAYVKSGTDPGYQDALLTIQHVATRNGVDVRAINHSWGKPLASGDILDGDSLLALGIDWSASQHNVLHVVAGNEDLGGIPVPTDSFNGMTIAASEKVGDVYRQVAFLNAFDEDAEGERTSIDLIAPGIDVRSTLLNDMLTPPVPQMPNDPIDDGTSFAAPHVTGTVALLHQHAESSHCGRRTAMDGQRTASRSDEGCDDELGRQA